MAEVESTTGQIKFDTKMDNQFEMTLNKTGLGIGVAPSTNLHVNGNAIFSDQLFIGGISGSSNLNVNGTLGYGFQTVSSNTILGETSVVLIDSSSDNITITLPYAGNVSGRQYKIKKVSTSNYVWISGGGNLIDDTNSIEMPESSDLSSVTLSSDGNQWYKIDQKDLNETIAADNLVGWWKLDETSGNIAADDSLSSLDGTLQGGLDFSNDTTTGKIKNALVFDGTDDYIMLGSGKPNILQFSDQDFSVSVWAKTNFSTPYRRIVGADSGGLRPHGYALRKAELGHGWGFYFEDGNSERIESTYAGIDNTWQHIVGVYDRSKQYLYVDGILRSSDSNPNVIPDWVAISEISIGRRGQVGNTKYFDGSIDDVRIYNKALSASEIQALYIQGR